MTHSFANPLSRRSAGVLSRAREIKTWARELSNLPDDAVVSVSELACHVPGCPPKETVVLLMHSDQTIQVSLHKAIVEITQEDIATALSANAADAR